MSGTETSCRSSATTDTPSLKLWKMLLASLLFSPCLLSCFEKLNCTRLFFPTALGVCQSSRHCKMDVSLDSSTFLKFRKLLLPQVFFFLCPSLFFLFCFYLTLRLVLLLLCLSSLLPALPNRICPWKPVLPALGAVCLCGPSQGQIWAILLGNSTITVPGRTGTPYRNPS